MSLAIQYCTTLALFAAIDLIWLGVLAKGFYHRELGHLLAEKFNVPAAIAFYLLYPLGVVIFAVAPSASSGTWMDAAVRGAGLGFFAYATYDLTNLATLRQWPLRLALVDMLWGTLLTAMAAAGSHLLTRAIL